MFSVNRTLHHTTMMTVLFVLLFITLPNIIPAKSPALRVQPCCPTTNCYAKVCIASPQPGQCVPGTDVVVKFCSWNLNLTPGKDCIHIAIDNDPFVVHYKKNGTHTFKNVAPGTHTVRLYGCNAFHQAIPNAFASTTFFVQYDNNRNTPEQMYPMLTYNLPQGEYMGLDAKNILIDFLVTPAPAGTIAPAMTQVYYWVDGRRFIGNPDKTQSLPQLSQGMHTIKVELVDRFGKKIPGPFNSVERVIMVSPDKSPLPYDRVDGIQSIPGPATSGRYWISQEIRDRDLHQRVQEASSNTDQQSTPVTQKTAQGLMDYYDKNPAERRQENPESFSFRTNSMDGTQVRKVTTPTAKEGDNVNTSSGDTGDEGRIDRIRQRISQGTAAIGLADNKTTATDNVTTTIKAAPPVQKKDEATTTAKTN